MDPNATLRRIADLLHEEPGELTDESLDEACHDLIDWLMAGGFAPDWAKHPFATTYLRTYWGLQREKRA